MRHFAPWSRRTSPPATGRTCDAEAVAPGSPGEWRPAAPAAPPHPAREARLAQEVAEVLPLGWSLPFRGKERLDRVTDHLGGERELLEWLDRHPGLPRLTARLLALTGNLERFSADPAVIGALRSSGAGAAPPAQLKAVLPPALGDETLSDLGYHLDKLLFERHVQEAKQFALATTEWLRTAAGQSADVPSGVGEMRDVMGHLHKDISEAEADARTGQA